LADLYVHSQTWDPDSYSDIDQNPGWVTQYNNTPRSGDYLRILRHTPINLIRCSYGQNIIDYTLTNTYFSNLKQLWINHNSIAQKAYHDQTENLNNSFKNQPGGLPYMYNDSQYFRCEDRSFLSGGNLVYFNMYRYPGFTWNKWPIDYNWVEGSNLSLFAISPSENNWLNVDPLFGETVAVHVDFHTEQNQIPTQDRSRYQLSITPNQSGVSVATIN